MPSTVILSMEYDEIKQVLRITYTSGLVYDYFDVPPEVFQGLKTSGAKGIFLNREIKGKYKYVKVQDNKT